MKRSLFFIVFLLSGLFSQAFADYKIILKNGNEFVVKDYKEVDGKIKFYRMGGEIEIDKNSIAEIKEVKGSGAAEEHAPVEIKKDSDESAAPADKGDDAAGRRQYIESRLKEIEKRKEDMKTESEKLNSEKKQLEEDVKKEGRLTAYRKEREFVRRLSEIDEKIKKFNEELDKLNQEHESLSKELQSQQK